MPDDKTKVGEPDRSRAASDQNYEVSQLAQKHGLNQQQARDLIARVGNDPRNSIMLPRNSADAANAARRGERHGTAN